MNIDIIFEKILKKKISIFCGAGISLNSGVPLVKDIKSKILSTLQLEKSDLDFLMDYRMPFELFVECLIENSSNSVLLDLFEIGSYNTTHLFIAQLAREGYLKNIVTTNFDNFLETALDAFKVEYKLFYKESDFNKIDWESDGVKLIKMHGSIHDRDNMAITIKKVSNQGSVFQRNKIIIDLLKNSDSMLILGYSCSDIFDINPTIKNCQYKESTIYYFQHDNTKQTDYSFIPIKEKIEPNPFKDFQGFSIQGDTDEFIKDLWLKIFPYKFEQTQKEVHLWGQFIDNWIKETNRIKGEGILCFIAGQLINATTHYSKSLNYFFKGLDISEDASNSNLSVDFLFSIGRTYHGIQKLNESLQNSIRYLNSGLKKSRRHKLREKECSILLSLGIVHEDKQDHYVAIKFYEDALKIAKQKRNQVLVAKCLGNLGIVFKNMAISDKNNKSNLLLRALLFQRKSLQISIDTGDKRSEGRTYGNIAVILNMQAKKIKAIEYSLQALQIAVDLSDLYHQGIWKHNIGDYYIGIDNIKAKEYLSEAKEIFISEGLDSFLKASNETIEKLNKIINMD